MKIIKLRLPIRFCILLSLFFFSSLSVNAQGIPASGKNFYIALSSMSYVGTEPSYQFLLTAERTTTATLYTTGGTIVNLTVPAGDVVAYNLNAADVANMPGLNAAIYAGGPILYLSASDSICAYVRTSNAGRSDASLLFPPQFYSNSYDFVSRVSLFNPSVLASLEQSTTISPANGGFTATIGPRNLFSYLPSSVIGIRASSNTPIAAFILGKGLMVDGTQMSDYYHQILPVSESGRKYFIPVTLQGVVSARVTATQANTVIKNHTGTTITTLISPGNFYDITATAAGKGYYIEADKPVAVGVFMVSNDAAGASGYSPAFSWGLSTEQLTTDVLLGVGGVGDIAAEHVLIVARKWAKHYTTLSFKNGAKTVLDNPIWEDHPSGWSYCNYPITKGKGAYRFSNPTGIIVYAYSGAASGDANFYLAGVGLRGTLPEPPSELPDNIVDAECFADPKPTAWGIKESLPVYINHKIHNYMPLLVGDIDGDGKVEIVAGMPDNRTVDNKGNSNYPTTGLKFFTYNGSSIVFKNQFTFKNNLDVGTYNTLAMARYNNKGYIVMLAADNYLYAYSPTGTELWKSSVPGPGTRGMPGFADFNNDGIPEVYIGNQIFALETGLLLCSGGANNKGSSSKGFFMTVAADVLGNDGKLELCAGTQIYDVKINSYTNAALNSITVLTDYELPAAAIPADATKEGFTQVVDIDLDGTLDIVLTSGTTKNVVYVWRPGYKSSALIGSYTLASTGNVSVPMIGDIDGDGYPEITLIANGTNIFYAIRYDKTKPMGSRLVQKWTTGHTDGSSGCTGMCLFDFNQDKKFEIVYRDETDLRIFDGTTTGNAIATFPNIFSGTLREHPIVADLDGDGAAEIAVSGGIVLATDNQNGYLRVFKSNGSAWAPARKVWNQYTYNAVNINEDLTVPKVQLNPATIFPGKDGILGTLDDVRPYNGFFMQQTILNKNGTPLWLTPQADLRTQPIFNYDAAKDSMSISVTVHNIGDAAFQNPFKITAYKNTVGGTPKHTHSYAGVINAGNSAVITFGIPKFKQNWAPFNNIVFRLNDSGNGYNDQVVCDSAKRDFKTGTVMASDDRVLVFQNSTGNLIKVLENDIYPSACTPVVTILQNAKHGTHTLSAGVISYAPSANYLGNDTIRYKITCGTESSEARVYITAVSKPDNIVDADCIGEPNKQEWSIKEVATASAANYSIGQQVLIGDIDGDGETELLTTNSISGNADRVYILDKNAAIKKSFPINTSYIGAIPLAAIGKVQWTAGVYKNIIVVLSDATKKLYIYDSNGILLKTSDANYTAGSVIVGAAVSIVDLDGDGWAELVVGNRVFAAETANLLCTVSGGDGGINHGWGYNIIQTATADVLGQGNQQICVGNTIYKVSITNRNGTAGNTISSAAVISPVLYDNTIAPLDGCTQTVDLDLDGHLDVVVSTVNQVSKTCYIYVWSPKKNAIIASTKIANVYKKSVPFVGNIDGDAYPEIVFIHGKLPGNAIDNSTDKITALKYNPASPNKQLSIFWQLDHDDTSGATAISLFDFNQDNISELVYRDEKFLRIINGSKKSHHTGNDTTAVYDLDKFVCTSATGFEYPVVADVDGDGQAEIVVVGHTTTPTAIAGFVRIFKSNGQPWAPARKVWNQYAYNAVNVNEDLTIPKVQLSPATVFPGKDGVLGTLDDVRPYNGFLMQQTILNKNGTPLWLTPQADLRTQPIFNYDAAKDSMSISVTVHNIGDAAFQNPFKITAYKNTVGGTPKHTHSYAGVINAGNSAVITFGIPKFKQNWAPFNNIVFRLNDSGNGYNDQVVCDSAKRDFKTGTVMASDDRVLVFQNSTGNLIKVLENDIYPSACTPVVTILQNAKHGTHTLSAGVINYTPSANYLGNDTIRYKITCGTESSEARVYITAVSKPDNIVDADCYVEPNAKEWGIELLYQSTETVFDMDVPLVADLDGRGNMIIVASAPNIHGTPPTTGDWLSNKIHIFDAKTGNVRRTMSLLPTFFPGTGTRALADVDNDGIVDLILAAGGTKDAEAGYLHCYDLNTGVRKWKSTQKYTNDWFCRTGANIMITDFNGDGIPEVLILDKIYNAATGDLLLDMDLETLGLSFGYGGGHGVDWSNCSNSMPYFPAVADMDNNGLPEMVAGNYIYKINLTNSTGTVGNSWSILRQANARVDVVDGATVVTDLNLDGYLDVIVTCNVAGTLYLYAWDGKTNQLLNKNPITFPGAVSLSVPFIGDIDGDGYPEISITSNGKTWAYKYNPITQDIEKFWDIITNDGSGATTLTMFDFNQDGIAELVYRDELNLRIINGSLKSHYTGNDTVVYDLKTFPCSSWTMNEYPVVADVTGDGQANIIVFGKPVFAANGTGYLNVYKSEANKPWAPARKVWNQYAYNAVNVNEDLTIPKYQLNPATVFPGADGVLGTADDVRPYNGFLMQQTALNKDGNPLWLAPNAQIGTPAPSFNYSAAGDSMQIKLVINNVGDAALQAPVKITVYKDVVGATPKYTYAYPNTVLAGGSANISFAIPNFKTWLGATNSTTKLIVKINDNGNGYNDQLVCDSSDVTHTKPYGNLLMANTDYASTFTNDTIRVNVLANDSTGTCTRNALTAFDTIPASGLKNGTLAINADSTFTYTPKSNFTGIDSVTYYIKCGADSSAAKVYFMTVKPNALHYTACPNAVVTMGVKALTGVSFRWYTTATGGAIPAPSLTYNLTKDASVLQTIWVEPEYKGVKYPRVPMYLSLASSCAETDPSGCAKDGTVLFKEDFGGNQVSAPRVSSQILAPGLSDLNFCPTGSGSCSLYGYCAEKYSTYPGFVTNVKGGDDHTVLGDTTRGYYMYIDPAPSQLNYKLYGSIIKNLCVNSRLNFSFWAADFHSGVSNTIARPKVEMLILDARTKDTIVTTGVFQLHREATPQTFKYRQYGFDFVIPQGVDSILFSIINKEVDNIGNDWAIDDIEIRFCAPPVVVSPGNDTTVCLGSKLDLQLKDDYVDDGTFGTKLDFRWEFKAKGTLLWDLVSGTASSSTNGRITAAQSKHTITSTQVVHGGDYRFVVAATGNINSENCRATGGFALTVAKAPFKYPDVRIQLCAQPNRSIFLNSYLDTLELKSIVWTKLSSTGAIGVNTGEIQTNDLLKGTYVYRYSVENLCVKDSAKVYVKVLGNFVVNADTVVICKEMLASTLMNLKQIFGLEAGGTITAVTAGAGTYLSHMAAPSLYRDAYYFKARAAWDDPAFGTITYNGDNQSKLFEFEYQPALGTCVNYPVKLVLIVTSKIIP